MSKTRVLEYIYITFGIVIMAISFYFFMVPYDLFVGGVSGLAIILQKIISTDVAIIIYIFNILALILGMLYFGRKFFVKTVYGSIAFPFAIQLCMWIDSYYKITPVTNDLLLAVVFGALLTGIGFGIILRFGGSTGGMDIPQKVINSAFRLPFSLSVYLLDGFVVLFGVFIIGIEKGLYSVLAVILIGQFVDIVLITGKSSKSVYIITSKHAQIKKLLFVRLNRGVTQFNVVGGYTDESKVMLLCIVSNREYYKVIKTIHEIDTSAFVFVSRSSEVLGEGFNENYEHK